MPPFHCRRSGFCCCLCRPPQHPRNRGRCIPRRRTKAGGLDRPFRSSRWCSTLGVGYFEHYGTVKGDGFTELHFKTEQINDILKSLLLEDLDKGKISSVTYGSQEPLAHTLKSFQVDLSAAPPLSDLLSQLRGASVTATLAKGQVTGQFFRSKRSRSRRGKSRSWMCGC